MRRPPALKMATRYGSGVSGAVGGVLGGVGPGSGSNMGGGSLAYEQMAATSNQPQTTTTGFDDFFEYSLTDPITIRKNESALVPILQTKIPSERVTLWSPSEPVPLRALWITNSSNLTLDRGSFSIVEQGSFGGEGLLDPVHPGEKRLLSYAADQAVRVSTDYSKNTRKVLHLRIKEGVLTETSTDVSEVEYLVHNAAPEARTVIVEQPVRQGWTLDSDPKPAETTPTAYRFRVANAAERDGPPACWRATYRLRVHSAGGPQHRAAHLADPECEGKSGGAGGAAAGLRSSQPGCGLR